MPRTLSSTLLWELSRLESDHPIVFLFEVTIQGAPGILRYAVFDQDIVFQGFTFTRIPAQVEKLEDATSAALVNLRVTIQNVDQTFSALAENYWSVVANPLWQVTVWQIDAQQPNEVPYAAGERFVVASMTTDLWQVTVDLVAEGLSLTMVLPKRKYARSSGFSNIPMRV